MAHIRQRAPGKWRAEIERGDIRRSKTFRTRALAAQWAIREEAALQEEGARQFPSRTFADAMRRYAADVSPGKRGHRWEVLRLVAIERMFPALAAKIVSDIATPDLVAWRDARLRVVTPGTVQRDINLLRNVFAVARDEWHWCGERSPFKGLRMPGDNAPRRRRISPYEARALVRYLGYSVGAAPRSKGQEVAYAFLIALHTGLRAGELLQLSDATVDLERRVATIGQHKTEYRTRRPRVVPFTPAAARLMRPLAGRGAWFTLTSASLDSLFRSAKRALLIKGMTFHDSRAEALTRLARRYDVLTFARLSGHRDLQTLMDVYYRESDTDVAARLASRTRPHAYEHRAGP